MFRHPAFPPRVSASQPARSFAFLLPTVSLAIALGGAFGCSPAPSAQAELAEEDALAPPVEIVEARIGSLPLVERVNGVVKAENQVAIRSEIDAPIVEVLVRSGEAVTRGQPLVRLDDAALTEQLRQAEASVRVAEATAAEARARVKEIEARVTRSRALFEEDLVSGLTLETEEAQLAAASATAAQTEAQVERSRATVAERRSALDRTLVRAPVSGRIGQRHAEVGMMADPGTVLFVIGNLDTLVIEIALREQLLGDVEPGTPVRIVPGARSAAPLDAQISRISPFLDETSFSAAAEIDVPQHDGRLQPGMFVKVDVLHGQTEEATLLPTSALWEDPRTGERGLFVVRSDTPFAAGAHDAPPSEQSYPVEFRRVDVLAEGRGTIGVDRVTPGEWVVTIGMQLLDTTGSGRARVRPVTWERVLELQELQREDVLAEFLAKQREMARVHGAQPPSNAEFLRGKASGGSGSARR